MCSVRLQRLASSRRPRGVGDPESSARTRAKTAGVSSLTGAVDGMTRCVVLRAGVMGTTTEEVERRGSG